MRTLVFLFSLALIPFHVAGQGNGFAFGRITYADLGMKSYPNDTTAVALVLDEFGETYKDNEEPYDLKFEYHVRIKILKRDGLEEANVSVPIRVGAAENSKEKVTRIKASTFNMVNGSIKETPMSDKVIFRDNRSKYWDVMKFTLPDVTVGSIIEYSYVLSSPYIFNWRTWEFQREIPKMKSEFWAMIPGNYIYNITLRGALPLNLNTQELVQNCYTPGGGMKADCALMKYGIQNVPAFRTEQYMTASSNFISAIYYELAEVRRFDGSTERYTEDWKNVDQKLKSDESFGQQIRRASKLWEDRVKESLQLTDDPAARARKVFTMIRDHYTWNEVFGHFTDLGAKKAYEQRKGNIADINLSLIGALQAAGFDAEPAMLSTRANGLLTTVHPVMSEFNYVVARVPVGADMVFLDATDKLHPFGFLPERCLNGKARVMGKNPGWVDIKTKDRDRNLTSINLMVDNQGSLSGTITMSHFGYDGYEHRTAYHQATNLEDYLKERTNTWSDLEVTDFKVQATDSLDKPFVEVFKVRFKDDFSSPIVYLAPFMVNKWEKNPFTTTERNFPVDFGAPLEEVLTFSLEYPDGYQVESLPDNAALILPQQGGRFLFSTSNLNHRISLTSSLTLNKTVYQPGEYPALREMFTRVIQVQASQLVFKK